MSVVRLDDANIPVADTIVGLTVTGMQNGQVVAVPPLLLKGIKGDDGEPLTYADLTPTQIAALQKPATDMITDVNQVIVEAEAATQDALDAAALASGLAVLTSEAVTDVTEYNEITI